jgi:hypothetical protein
MKSQKQPKQRAASKRRRRSALPKKRVAPGTSRKVTDVIAKMRSGGVSLRKAARESGVAPRTVLKRAASALRKNESGRYIAKAGDRLVRALKIPTPHGSEEIRVRGLRAASKLGRYWETVHKYYETGEVSGLQKFRGESITAVGGEKYPFVTDLDVLDRLGSAGVLSFESLYGRSA